MRGRTGLPRNCGRRLQRAPYWLCTGGLYRSTQGSCIFERRRQDSAKNEAYSLAGDYLRNMLIAGVLSYGTSRHTHTYA